MAYWHGVDTSANLFEEHDLLLSFDISNGVFQTTPLPDELIINDYQVWSLDFMDDNIVTIVENRSPDPSKKYALWMLPEYALLADAQLLGGILGLTQIRGTLFCSVNGSIGSNSTTTPVFPNALVQLQCGTGNVVASATTNAAGVFTIFLNPLQFVLSSLLTNCNLIVRTPLVTCNSSLPTNGILISTLQFFGRTVGGIINIIPTGFNLLN
ncbi:Phylloplanin [Thalictrum thalictroides]|uniref:Phylloplanin n=1 Tax=Thalictrum thalictroides TaxID=46969 RepID=A0A7J6VDF9_THATH|nr:Phylloplanin [Thalictrum thalictroides]